MAVVRRRSDGWACLAGLGGVVLCSTQASSGTVGDLERRLFESINHLPDALEPAMRAAQFLGVLAIGPIVAVVALACRRPRLAVAAIAVTVLKLLSERIVWQLVQRDRPGVTEPGAIVRAGTATSGLSFVSGHVVLVTGLAWVALPYLHGRWKLVAWGAVLLVAFARIYLGAHNPLDVAGGFALGIAIGGAVNLAVGVPVPTDAAGGRGAAPAAG